MSTKKDSSVIQIAISGKSGCGNTTVSKLVAEELDFKHINYTFHTIAEEEGISFSELCREAEKDSKWDYYLDEKQVELASREDCVLGSRLAIWLLKTANLRVFLEAPLEVRAERISTREKKPFSVVLEETHKRDENDSARYKRLYGIDHDNYSFADLILDAALLNPEQIKDRICQEITKDVVYRRKYRSNSEYT